MVRWAAGGIVSTAADLNRFYYFLTRNEVVPASLLAQMKQTVPGPGLDYGLMKAHPSVRHPGLGTQGPRPGYATCSFHNDRRDLTVTANALYSRNDERGGNTPPRSAGRSRHGGRPPQSLLTKGLVGAAATKDDLVSAAAEWFACGSSGLPIAEVLPTQLGDQEPVVVCLRVRARERQWCWRVKHRR